MIQLPGRPLARPITALLLLLVLTACVSKPGTKVSSQGMQLCREQQADAPPGTSMEAKRGGYRACLKTIDTKLKEQAQKDKAERNAEAQQAQQQALDLKASSVSANERYIHCRLMQQQVIEAERMRIRTLGPAMVAARQYGDNSPQAQSANGNYRDAVANLERLIPEPMRVGMPLIPDAVNVYRQCDPADFKN